MMRAPDNTAMLRACARLARPGHWILLTLFAIGCLFVPLASAGWLLAAVVAAIVAEVAEIRLEGRMPEANWRRQLEAADGAASALSAALAFACLALDGSALAGSEIAAVLCAQVGCARAAGLLCAVRFAPRTVESQPPGGEGA